MEISDPIASGLFPGDNTAKKISFLMPSDRQSIKCLFWVRFVACGYFTFHVTLVIVNTYDEFWMYLTNLTYCFVMMAYCVIFYAHLKNQDYAKAEWR